MLWGILLATAVFAAIAWQFRPAARRARRIRRLESSFLATDPRGPEEAAAALRRHLEGLEERFPGKDRVWYLQRLLSDARRARR